MKLLWSALLVFSLVLLSNVSHGQDDEEDDDGVVEDVPDENIVREKVIFLSKISMNKNTLNKTKQLLPVQNPRNRGEISKSLKFIMLIA